MNRQQSAAVMAMMAAEHIIARPMSSLRTYGSRTRLKDMKVYSENPAKPSMGSSMY